MARLSSTLFVETFASDLGVWESETLAYMVIRADELVVVGHGLLPVLDMVVSDPFTVDRNTILETT